MTVRMTSAGSHGIPSMASMRWASEGFPAGESTAEVTIGVPTVESGRPAMTTCAPPACSMSPATPPPPSPAAPPAGGAGAGGRPGS